MMNKFKEQMKNMKLLILNIVIIILTIFLVIVLIMTIEEVHYAFTDYEVEDYSFLYNIEDEYYGEMVENYYQNCGSSRKEEKEMQEYYGVAKYFEAAFFYKMYAENGDAGRAEKYAADMERAVEQMGDFAFVEEKINKKLGLTE